MTIYIAYFLVGLSTSAFVVLWFWVVWQALDAKRKAVEAARCQLIASKQAHLRARNSPKEKQALEIMERSECVYNQSVQLYHNLRHKPWNALPGALMGFQKTVGEHPHSG
ncbi:MAG: hypothetical protein RR022_00680 [Angelakisella sp.]